MIVILLTAVVTLQGVRVGQAQWLAFAADVPGGSPAGSTELLARAAALAPWNGPLSLWTAGLAHQVFLSAWLSTGALAKADTATATAAVALRAHPGNPYAHIHVARVALARARHPRTEEPSSTSLRGQANNQLAIALTLYPSSADVGHSVAATLLPEWAALEGNTREVALDAIRQVGRLDRLRFPQLLAELAETLAVGWSSEGKVLETLRTATPEEPWALNALFRRLMLLADSPPPDVPNSWPNRAREAGVSALANATIASGLHPTWVRRWIAASVRTLPDSILKLVDDTRVLANDHPEVAGAWLARALSTFAAGQLDQARGAAERARVTARDALAHALELPNARPATLATLSDEQILRRAEARMSELRAADRSEAETREALNRGRLSLEHAMDLLVELGEASAGQP